jgi:glucose-6-phosphate 1-dehydrogenase
VTNPRGDGLVLFGATGDLARRRLLPALYCLTAKDRLDMPVVGVASSEWTADELRERARAAVEESEGGVDDDVFRRMAQRLDYVSGDYRDPDLYQRLKERLGPVTRPVCYLAIPPSLFDDVVNGLAAVGLNHDGRVVLEKPFGRDLASARELNRIVLAAYPERSVFRIDHFLGKEALLNLVVQRFANAIWEPIWNRNYVSAVQITLAEDFGVLTRGRFYEEVGALRDVVQNHLFQLLCLLAMDPPVSTDADALRDEVVKVLKAARPIDPHSVVRGQYDGYRHEDGVALDSEVETFVALELWIDSWRWAGVPFLVRAGKRLARTVTEAVVEFRAPPQALFAGTECFPEPNQFRYQILPDETTQLVVQGKQPGEGLLSRSIALEVDRRQTLGPGPEAYERLLDDALDGEPRLFARQDAVEESWRIVDDVLRRPPRATTYAPGSWGPAGADDLARPHGGWRP